MNLIIMRTACALSVLSLWTAFGGFIYCAAYKKRKRGAVWIVTVAAFTAFFVFLFVWAVLRNTVV